MSIDIAEHFSVHAPIDRVWDFLLDPHAVVQCMPGAALDEIEDDETFLGSIKVKIGPIVSNYKGRVRFLERDEAARVIRLSAEGRDSGGGTARGEMSSKLIEEPGGGTRIEADSSVILTGRVMQFGRGIHEGVARKLFAEFAQRVTQQLDGETSDTPANEEDALSIAPIVASVAASAITNPVRRLFGGKQDNDKPAQSDDDGGQQ